LEPSPNADQSAHVGATVPDLILRIFASPFLTIPLFALVVLFILSIGFGFIELSWVDSGLKLSQGQRYSQVSDVSIAGTWRGVAKDLDSSDGHMKRQYSYRLSMTFDQKGTKVQMHGWYFVNEDTNLPQRIISGEGIIHGDYLSLLYDIEVKEPAPAKTHGTILFKLAPSSNSATGYYVARGMANDRFVFGSMDLSR
jgi:hypothetical protein